MTNKDSGFSGLSNMSSESISDAQVAQKKRNETANHSLIEMTKWPSMPALWSSKGSGEAWVWGNFFFILQKEPKTILEWLAELQGKKGTNTGMIYHYAMTVFYNLNKNPHGPSHRPIMAIGLEQADYSRLAQLLDSKIDTEGVSKGPIILGLFTGDSRMNFGEYLGDLNQDSARKQFFSILGQQLNLKGQPRKIGVMNDAFGHPETGLPAKKKSFGCALVIGMCIGIAMLGHLLT